MPLNLSSTTAGLKPVKWLLSQLLGSVLMAARKGVASSATGLITTLVQTHGTSPLMKKWMWKGALKAIDLGE